jgi:hypothetical protein
MSVENKSTHKMENHKDMLEFILSNAPLTEKIKLLKNINQKQAKIISEIVVNVLYGVLQITPYYKRKLEPFKK